MKIESYSKAENIMEDFICLEIFFGGSNIMKRKICLQSTTTTTQYVLELEACEVFV